MAVEGFLSMSINSIQLEAAITGLDGIDRSLRDMQSLKSQISSNTKQIIEELKQATPLGENPKGPRMRDSWMEDPPTIGAGEFTSAIVNTADHARWVIGGTGLFGPTGSIIYADVEFVFFSRGQTWHLTEHRGQQPNQDLNPILDGVGLQWFRAAGRALRGLLAVMFNQMNAPSQSGADLEESLVAEFGPRANSQGLTDVEDF